MKILLLAGEESGLIYADRLRSALSGHEIRGYADYGFDVADLAVMGVGAVLRKLFFFLRVKRTLELAIDEWHPDVVLTIDYPGLNLKLAAYAKARGIRAVHVVCPQVWAWRAGRIPKIEAALDRLCCFFPFEPALFRPGFAEFVGHPLVGMMEEARRSARVGRGDKPLVALLPGSRLGEIERNLPVMLESVCALDVDLRLPAASARARAAIETMLAARPTDASRVAVQDGGARELLLAADCALVASGTATLEAALARCPTVLVYRVSTFFAWLARRVIKSIRHVGLANIIAEKAGEEPPMPELLQEDFTAANAEAILANWLGNEKARCQAALKLDRTIRLLESDGDPILRIVAMVVGARG